MTDAKRALWTMVLVCATATATLIAGDQRGAGPDPAGAGGAQAAPLKGTGLILGQVVDFATGRPIPEATVTVTYRGAGAGRAAVPIGARPGGPASTAGTHAKLLTGADGYFVVHDLPAGTFAINATAAGYTAGNSGQVRPLGPSRPVDLEDGERLNDVKIRLWKHAVLTGSVVDEHAEPAVGITVRMLRRSIVNGKPRFTPGVQAKTDDRGVYRLGSITPGTFMIVVPQTPVTMPTSLMDGVMQSIGGSLGAGSMADLMAAGASSAGGGGNGGGGLRVGDLMVQSPSGQIAPGADGRVLAYPTLFHPSVTSPAQASVLTLGSGEERAGVDFQLRPMRTAKVTGTVVGPPGSPFLSQIRLVAAGVEALGHSNGLETAIAMMAADGSFSMLGVPSGQYTLSLVREPLPPMPPEMASNPMMQMMMGGAGGGHQPQTTMYAQMPVSVGASDIIGVSLVLTEGARVTGRIAFDGAAPPPPPWRLQALTVQLNSTDGRPVSPSNVGPLTDRVDQDNGFKTQGYPPGRYVVNVTGVLGPQWTLKSVVSGGRDLLMEPFELKDTDLADVVMTYTDKIGSISGTVHGLNGSASTPATVVLFPLDYQTWIQTGMSQRRFRTVLTSKNGAFSAAGLLAGEYLMVAVEDTDLGDPQDPAVVETLARQATRITLADGEKKSQDLQIVKVQQ